jgi:hypothetical protein
MRTSGLLLLLIFWIQAHPQACIQNVALRAGYCQSTQSPDWYRPDQVNAWRNNIHSIYFGCDYNILLNPKWGLKCGIQVSQKGMQVDYSQYGPVIGNETDYLYHLSYLDIPLCINLNKKKWQFSAGIQASYLLNSSWNFRQKQIYYTTMYIVSYYYIFPSTNNYHRFDYGINLGATRRLNDYLDIEFMFIRGLTVPDKYDMGDIRYQESFLFGFKYYFLKTTKYLAGR